MLSSTLRKPSLFSFPFARLLPALFSSSFSSCKRRSLSPFLPSPFKPPFPKKIPTTISVHGSSWDDPFHWMSNTADPDLLHYLDQENSYAEAFMADTQELQRTLFSEMKGRMPPKVSTPPERWGKWLYYQHVPEGKEYPVLCRKLSCDDGFLGSFFKYKRHSLKVETLLDWNEIAEQYGYVNIGTCRISPDHNFLAYTLDTRGSELFVLQLKDLRTGSMILGSEVEGVLSLAWASDSNCLFYTLCDENQRPNRVFCRKLGTDVVDDLLFTENDLSCCVDITSTKDGKFVTINSNSRISSEEDFKNGLWLVRKRVPGVQYFLEHHNGFFYILTNAPMENISLATEGYHLVRCRAEKLSLANWQDIAVPGPGITLQDMDMFHGHLVLSLCKEGLPMLCSISMPINFNGQADYIEDLNPWFFPLPSTLCSFLPGSNHDFASSVYRVVVSSPVVPDLIVDYDMVKQRFTFLHQEEVMGLATSNNPSRIQSDGDLHLEKVETSQKWTDLSETYSCERREVISHDGVLIPLTILYSRKVQFSGNSPGLIYGYGAYGEVLDKGWCADHISLLDRGWVIAYADVRGGGDTTWHQAGTRMNKPNSFHDFAACAIYLISEGYVRKNQLAAIGCSAGGLLVGATINKYPDLFCAAILKVPFLDISNTMLDPSLPLTILDYDEFGDPNIQAEFETIHSYSPYDNILPGVCYPSTLVTASLHDSRVGVWEAAKWVAKVREKTCPNCSHLVILNTNMNSGHFSEGGRLKHCEDTAFAMGFKSMLVDDDMKLEKGKGAVLVGFSRSRMKMWIIRVATTVLLWTCLVQLTAIGEIWAPRVLKGSPSCFTPSPRSVKALSSSVVVFSKVAPPPKSCTQGCTKDEAGELTRMRYAYPWWKEKVIDSDMKRKDGLCPLTPEETTLTLRALDIDQNIQIYIAAGEIYGGKRRMASLSAAFPNLVRKETLLEPSDLRYFQNHSSQMAALDYLVSLESDIFVPTYDGNMAKVVEGHRRYSGYRKSLLLDRKLLVELIDRYNNGSLAWDEFSSSVKAAHTNRMGMPTRRVVIPDKPKEEDYFYSNPQECLQLPDEQPWTS
ncbi:hypothetical protein J5N97_005217 [Dioscorea zingiberensis]|uniref:Prolyl endopeptidase-like n=1 Tax=Dioscorea zingiberensis TaxID=325984 RepID=A0A9D5D848_9LILI|nr:hypothetical protein J5N97_005217 [Dioscorea zingiberensis]